jgi:predicted ATPase
MSLAVSERHPLPNLSPQRKKERTLEALSRQLEGLARRQPVLMVFEDAHWIHPTSRELLDLTIERLRTLPVLLIVAQIGAAIGRQFPYALLRAVFDLPEDELRMALARLVASELVFQRGTPPDAVYTFKHALVQDAAHGSLLRSSRQQLHAQIAEALEAQSPELTDSQPEIFAQHYAEAGLVEKSVAYWGKAGQRSAARSAMAEAAAQLQKGLDQLALLPDAPGRRRRELEFYSALGAASIAVKGLAASENRPCICPRPRIVGAAGFAHGISACPLGTVNLPRDPRRTGSSASLGQRFAASEPSTKRFCRARSRSRLLWSKPDVWRGICLVPIASGKGASTL